MAKLLRKLIPNAYFKQQIKSLPNIRCTRIQNFMNMDDDGDTVPEGMKTKVTILNEAAGGNIMIDAYSTHGFRLNTGVRLVGPCVVFPRSILHWNVSGAEGINADSLSLFKLLEPRIDLLIIGVGEHRNLSVVDSSIIMFLKTNKINVEILSTEQALTTFNFLNSERRSVAGAFIPPDYIPLNIGESEYDDIQLASDTEPFKVGTDYYSIDEGYENPMESMKLLREKRKTGILKKFYEKKDKSSGPVDGDQH